MNCYAFFLYLNNCQSFFMPVSFLLAVVSCYMVSIHLDHYIVARSFLVLWFLNRVCNFHCIIMLPVELPLLLFISLLISLPIWLWRRNILQQILLSCIEVECISLIILCLGTLCWDEMFLDIILHSSFWNMSIVFFTTNP